LTQTHSTSPSTTVLPRLAPHSWRTFTNPRRSPTSPCKVWEVPLAPHKGKARYKKYTDDRGHKIIINDHNALVCPGLHSHILSIPNWNWQNKEQDNDDKIHISSYGDLPFYSRDTTSPASPSATTVRLAFLSFAHLPSVPIWNIPFFKPASLAIMRQFLRLRKSPTTLPLDTVN
jgi:hypothetical protein